MSVGGLLYRMGSRMVREAGPYDPETVAPEAAATVDAEIERALLMRWTCLACGETWDVEAPGFPGTTAGGYHAHFRLDPETPCGPIVAQRADVALGLAQILDRARLRPNP